jgi:hypothetical protein
MRLLRWTAARLTAARLTAVRLTRPASPRAPRRVRILERGTDLTTFGARVRDRSSESCRGAKPPAKP